MKRTQGTPRRSVPEGLLLGALLGLYATGCSTQAPAAGADKLSLSSLMLSEIQQFQSFFSLTNLFFFAVGCFLLWASLRLMRGAAHLVWRLGLDRKRSLEPLTTWARVALLAISALLFLRWVASHTPLFLGVVLSILALTLALACGRHLPSALVGVRLLLRRSLRQGDRVHLANHHGTVREVGLSQLHLRRPDGTALFVPNRLLTENIISIEHAKNSSPVRARLPKHILDDSEQLELARQIVALSPYRIPGSAIEWITDPESSRVTWVEIHTWSDRLVAAAEKQISRSLALQLPRGPIADKNSPGI